MIQKQKMKSINQTKAVSEQITSLKEIPLLDMQDEKFGEKIVQSFKNIGFVVIKNHGISQQLIDQVFGVARQVFQINYEEKSAIKFNFDKNRGYSGRGKQILDESNKNNEKKQIFNVGHPDGPQQLNFYPKNDKFIQTSKKIYQELFQINKKIMRSIEIGLKVEQGSITNRCCKRFYDQTLRYLYYPEITPEQLQRTGKTRAGAHSDFGTISLLLQKPGFGQGGLTALSSDKHWVKVTPPDYCLVVNLGDLFQHWTNDVLKSTIHKVEVDSEIYQRLQKGEITKVPERQTIVMFCDPDVGEVFSCLPGFGQPKYQPINGKKYIQGRVQALYSQKN